MSGLKIARGFELPIDVAGESTAILAKKGAGKSNTAKVIVEEVLDHGGVQVIALDPIGHWWSLRAGADGKPRGGYAVAVFGGMHGDLPLEETAGKLLAKTAVDSGQSIVLDVSGLDTNGAMQRFVYEFLEELYKLKQATPTPTLLVLEEADEFAPQDPKGANVPRMVGAANRISKRGRGRGIGMLYVTQRSAALNKNVLDQADTLIVMRTMGPRDRAAIEGWVKYQSADGMDAVLPSLPSLQTGEAWIWTPQRGVLERVHVRKARTFDSSQTPKPGESAIVASVKPIDVDALGEAIKATVERAKENDPAELRRQVRAERERADAAERTLQNIHELEQAQPEPVRVEVPVFNGEVDELREAVRALVDLGGQLHDAGEAVVHASTLIASAIATATKETPDGSAHAKTAPPQAPRAPRAPAPAQRQPPAPAAPAPPSAHQLTESELPLGARKVLSILAQFPEGRTRRQLAIASGYKATGSTMRGALAELRKRDLIAPAGVEPIAATAAGLAVADVDPVPTSGREMYEHWLRHSEIPSGSRRILELLYEAWPTPISRDDLADALGYEPTGSTMRGALARLRAFELISPAGVEPMQIADELVEDR